MMVEILTKSGAVIHVDDSDPAQQAVLPVAIAAFGGAISVEEIGS